MRIMISLLLLVLGLSSCEQTPFLAEKRFDGDCWDVADTLRFTYNNPAAGERRAQVKVDFGQEFAYMNVYLKLVWQSPSGKTGDMILSDTLMDPLGNWNVERSGGSYPVTFSPAPTFRLEETGNYPFYLIQYMRDSSLCEVKAAGVGIEE